MDDQKGQTPHPPLVVTNKGDVNWRGQGKRYPLKEKRRTQWGGYGKQYGTGGERNQVTRLMELMEPKPKVVILLMHCKGRAIISQLEVLGMDKVEMGEMKDRNDRKKYRILKLALKMIAMKRVIQKILMNWR